MQIALLGYTADREADVTLCVLISKLLTWSINWQFLWPPVYCCFVHSFQTMSLHTLQAKTTPLLTKAWLLIHLIYWIHINMKVMLLSVSALKYELIVLWFLLLVAEEMVCLYTNLLRITNIFVCYCSNLCCMCIVLLWLALCSRKS